MLSIQESYSLVGNVKSSDYQQIRQWIQDSIEKGNITATIQGLIPSDFAETRLLAKRKTGRQDYHYFDKEYILKRGNQYITLKDLQQATHAQETPSEKTSAETIADAHFRSLLKETGHPFVQFNISIGGKDAGSIVIELYSDIVPKTVKKFLGFVKGDRVSRGDGSPLSYTNTKISRVLPQGWIQAGELKDKSGKLIREDVFEDENFVLHHDRPGMVSMVNAGPHTNYSSFMITNTAMPYFDYKYVCFGRVVDGQKTLDRVNNVKCRFERPLEEIIITLATELEL